MEMWEETLFFSTIVLSTMLNIDKSRLWSYRPISFFSVLTKSCFTLPLPPRFKPAGSGFQAQQTNALGAEEGIHIGDQRGTSCWLQYCVYTIIQVHTMCSKYTKYVQARQLIRTLWSNSTYLKYAVYLLSTLSYYIPIAMYVIRN